MKDERTRIAGRNHWFTPEEFIHAQYQTFTSDQTKNEKFFRGTQTVLMKKTYTLMIGNYHYNSNRDFLYQYYKNGKYFRGFERLMRAKNILAGLRLVK